MTVEELETWTVKQLEDYLQDQQSELVVRFNGLATDNQRYSVCLHGKHGWNEARAFSLTAALAGCISMVASPTKDSGQ